MSARRKSFEPGHQRKFLVIVDETAECDRAVYYAARRAARTGGLLVLLSVISIGEVNQQWLGVGDLMLEEARSEADGRLAHFATRARNLAGIDPERVLKQGVTADEILKYIDEDEDVAVLADGAARARAIAAPVMKSVRDITGFVQS